MPRTSMLNPAMIKKRSAGVKKIGEMLGTQKGCLDLMNMLIVEGMGDGTTSFKGSQVRHDKAIREIVKACDPLTGRFSTMTDKQFGYMKSLMMQTPYVDILIVALTRPAPEPEVVAAPVEEVLEVEDDLVEIANNKTSDNPFYGMF